MAKALLTYVAKLDVWVHFYTHTAHHTSTTLSLSPSLFYSDDVTITEWTWTAFPLKKLSEKLIFNHLNVITEVVWLRVSVLTCPITRVPVYFLISNVCSDVRRYDF